MNQSQPEFVVFKSAHIWVISVVDNPVASGLDSEHDARVRHAAVKEHVVLDEAVDGRVADNAACRWTPLLVRELHYVRPQDVNVSITLHKVDLSLDARGNTDVIGVHACDVVSLHFRRHLHARVESLRQASIRWQGNYSDTFGEGLR